MSAFLTCPHKSFAEESISAGVLATGSVDHVSIILHVSVIVSQVATSSTTTSQLASSVLPVATSSTTTSQLNSSIVSPESLTGVVTCGVGTLGELSAINT